MFEILPLLHCLSPYISQTTLGQLGVIITALLTMSGRVTMLGISRWAGKGGSYRTVQRFFYTIILIKLREKVDRVVQSHF